jgi:hypothetical protein
LPTNGSITFRAIATDRFGNDGPVAELPVTVVPNQPPAVSLVRIAPDSGPVSKAHEDIALARWAVTRKNRG